MAEEWAGDDDVENDTKGQPIGAPGIGPFAVGPVDPLVYRQSRDIPELRPAAAYVRTDQRITVREAPPVEPQKREYSEWTPGGPMEIPEQATPKKARYGGIHPGVKTLFLLFLVLLPLAALGLLVRYVMSLYGY